MAHFPQTKKDYSLKSPHPNKNPIPMWNQYQRKKVTVDKSRFIKNEFVAYHNKMTYVKREEFASRLVWWSEMRFCGTIYLIFMNKINVFRCSLMTFYTMFKFILWIKHFPLCCMNVLLILEYMVFLIDSSTKTAKNTIKILNIDIDELCNDMYLAF